MSEERLLRLEEKIAYLERHVTAQDRAMLELTEELDALRRELRHRDGDGSVYSLQRLRVRHGEQEPAG